MPTFVNPAAGKTHHVVFKWNNDADQIGLVIPDMAQYAKQPYAPFNPSIRQGEASQQDFAIQSVWELQNDWSGGTGHLLEEQTETSRYAFAQGRDMTGTTTIGPCIFTAQKGRLLPPPLRMCRWILSPRSSCGLSLTAESLP